MPKPAERGRIARDQPDGRERREAEAAAAPARFAPPSRADSAAGAEAARDRAGGISEQRTGQQDETDEGATAVAAGLGLPEALVEPQANPEAPLAAVPDGEIPAPEQGEASPSAHFAPIPDGAPAQAAPSAIPPAAAPATATPQAVANAAVAQSAGPTRDGRPAGDAAPASSTELTARPGDSAAPVTADPAAPGFEAALAALDPAALDSLLAAPGATPSATPAPPPSAPVTTTGGAAGASDAKADAQPGAPAQALPVPLGAVPMTIGLRALAGMNRFEIRLDPVELGRVDVALEIDKEHGAVSARLVVERPETLALLQRDAGSLQQALSQAGFDATAAISLSLRGESEGRSGEHRNMPAGAQAPRGGDDTHHPIEAAPPTALRSLGGIDIRI